MEKLIKTEGITADEQETSIVIERNLDKMTIYTCDNVYITKLNKLIEKNSKDYKIIWTTKTGSKLEAPCKFLSLRAGTTVGTRKPMTVEQKAAFVKRTRGSRKTI